MATNAANHLSHYLRILTRHEDYLAPIRKWEALKVAREKEWTWVQGFSSEQAASSEVNGIPYKELFRAEEGRLFPGDSLLPRGREPQLLWTPIQQALPVKIEAFNHNFFGLEEKIEVRIIATEEEHPAAALLVQLDELGAYLGSASAIRVRDLAWVLIGEDHALIKGQPLLPLPGVAHWQSGTMLFPAGYKLELHLLAGAIRKKIDSDPASTILWNTNGDHCSIKSDQWRPLNLISYRKTILASRAAGNT